MIQLRGYSIGEQIHESATTLVFRATRDEDRDGRFLVRFTSVPVQARDFLDGYLERDERQRVT